ncbi:glycoside hydrolase family protein [Paenibacillus macerans]|uniref:Lysozyme n=1 Tax=Paenibacillus macerans TaxID=44252 RepID=A0A6N8F0E5_PAEMA|nr:glycoside hydrolase family protein [Paenibacillus macerans]MUG25405.1 glycoside hydrolase family protein [Paenibacillus macerans]
MSRKISQAGIRLIQNFEGCRLKAYKPVATEKYWTIGWGHYGPDVHEGMTITQSQADEMLVKDMAKYEAYVNDPSYVPVTAQLNQNQFDALVSFCYNCGAGNLKKLCAGRTIAQIAANITKYNKAGGNVLKGLVSRREAELKLFNTDCKEDDNAVEKVKKSDKANVIVCGKKIEDGFIRDGRVYVPLSDTAEAFGGKVNWDNKTKTATVEKVTK